MARLSWNFVMLNYKLPASKAFIALNFGWTPLGHLNLPRAEALAQLQKIDLTPK